MDQPSVEPVTNQIHGVVAIEQPVHGLEWWSQHSGPLTYDSVAMHRTHDPAGGGLTLQAGKAAGDQAVLIHRRQKIPVSTYGLT